MDKVCFLYFICPYCGKLCFIYCWFYNIVIDMSKMSFFIPITISNRHDYKTIFIFSF